MHGPGVIRHPLLAHTQPRGPPRLARCAGEGRAASLSRRGRPGGGSFGVKAWGYVCWGLERGQVRGCRVWVCACVPRGILSGCRWALCSGESDVGATLLTCIHWAICVLARCPGGAAGHSGFVHTVSKKLMGPFNSVNQSGQPPVCLAECTAEEPIPHRHSCTLCCLHRKDRVFAQLWPIWQMCVPSLWVQCCRPVWESSLLRAQPAPATQSV